MLFVLVSLVADLSRATLEAAAHASQKEHTQVRCLDAWKAQFTSLVCIFVKQGVKETAGSSAFAHLFLICVLVSLQCFICWVA